MYTTYICISNHWTSFSITFEMASNNIWLGSHASRRFDCLFCFLTKINVSLKSNLSAALFSLFRIFNVFGMRELTFAPNQTVLVIALMCELFYLCFFFFSFFFFSLVFCFLWGNFWHHLNEYWTYDREQVINI